MGWKIVRDFRTLNALEKRGFVRLYGGPKSRTRHWTGLMVREIRVQAGGKLESRYQEFQFRKRTFRIQYFDGSFYPFVTVWVEGVKTRRFV